MTRRLSISPLHEASGTPTAPTSPTAVGQQILYGTVDGAYPSTTGFTGDDLPQFPLRAGHQRITKAARLSANPLGSPLRLRRPVTLALASGARKSPQPLVRAPQAPIPLWEYPLPPRRLGETSSAGEITVLPALFAQQPTFDFLVDHDSSGRPSTSTLSHAVGFENILLGHYSEFFSCPNASHPGPLSDDFSAAVDMAVLASVNDVIATEIGNPGGWSDPEAAPDRFQSPEPASGPIFTSNPVAVQPSSSSLNGDDGAEGDIAMSTSPILALSQDDPMNETFFGWAGSWEMDTLHTPPPVFASDSTSDGLAEISHLEEVSLEDVSTFNPRRPTFTHFDVLMRLGHECGWPKTGVTRTELKRMLRACVQCRRFMYAERRAYHRCDSAAPDVRAIDFDLIQNMLAFHEHSGYSLSDLAFVLFRCQSCLRIFYLRTEDGTPDRASIEDGSVHRCGDRSPA
ncbi:hypothetical protein NMY22_g15776 [Coprinellus aureogranulatus]|nr:hypothetical protein NMY22_g15776 [Coprinellus aureogranulatus]